jgi:hypothetical protein
MKSLFFIVLIATPTLAQIVSLGAKVGVPLGDAFTSNLGSDVSLTSSAHRYLVGATAEVHLPLRVSVELDAIYKRTGFSTYFQSTDIGRFTNRVTANQWEFPLLAKYEIPAGRHLRPFVDAGPVLRHMTGIADSFTYVEYFPVYSSGSTSTNNSPYLQHRNSPGFVIGGGLMFKPLHIRISPEVRYTRWGTNSFNLLSAGSSTSNPNQEDFMVGVTF